MGNPKEWRSLGRRIEPWELALVKAVASRIRTMERDELESELARHLLRLKRNPPSNVQDWRAFLNRALHNRALNWIRDHQLREKLTVDLTAGREHADDDQIDSLEEIASAPEPDPDVRLALSRAWQELDGDLKIVWELLLEEQGNQVQVARRLKKHRNTVRLWVRQIQEVLRRHGF